MASIPNSVHVNNVLGLLGFLVIWVVLVVCARLLVASFRSDPLIGWAIGPLGVTTLYLSEPPVALILLSALFPAAVSAAMLFIGLFSSLPSPLALSHRPLTEALVIIGGVIVSSAVDIRNAMRDLRHPLWGEARILRTIQALRASWASIHFTAFGITYLRDRFDTNPTDLLQTI